MSKFLVEAYVPAAVAHDTHSGVDGVADAAGELSREGTPVRLLHAIFVPEDETGFYLYQARSSEAVREAATRAGLRFERVTEALTDRLAPSG
jgi:hypothetical protein